jgi:hypothetical protein
MNATFELPTPHININMKSKINLSCFMSLMNYFRGNFSNLIQPGDLTFSIKQKTKTI